MGAGSNLRVLRGGSFNNTENNLRAANRNRNNPDNRNDNIGFRVVSSRSSTSPEPPVGRRALRAEAKNGGACSRPSPARRRPGE